MNLAVLFVKVNDDDDDGSLIEKKIFIKHLNNQCVKISMPKSI